MSKVKTPDGFTPAYGCEFIKCDTCRADTEVYIGDPHECNDCKMKRIEAGLHTANTRINELEAALKSVERTIVEGKTGICDTIWYGPAETLVDFIHRTLRKTGKVA